MTIRFLPALLLLFCLRAFGQNEQPASPFPFNISLIKPDSSAVNSAAVLKTGKPTVLAFWLTTCPPCHLELAAYTKNYAEWQKEADFNLVAISMDFPERFAKVQAMVQEKNWPFQVYWDHTRAFKTTLPGGLNGLPQVFLFDKNGALVWQHKKYATGDEAELFAQIKALQAAR